MYVPSNRPPHFRPGSSHTQTHTTSYLQPYAHLNPYIFNHLTASHRVSSPLPPSPTGLKKHTTTDSDLIRPFTSAFCSQSHMQTSLLMLWSITFRAWSWRMKTADMFRVASDMWSEPALIHISPCYCRQNANAFASLGITSDFLSMASYRLNGAFPRRRDWFPLAFVCINWHSQMHSLHIKETYLLDFEF